MDLKSFLLRKFIHVSVGISVVLLYPLLGWFIIGIFSLIFVLINAFLLFKIQPIYEDRKSLGIVLFPLSVAFISFFAKNNYELFLFSLLPMFISDPISALLGRLFPFVRLNGKTLSGSLGFFISTFIIVHVLTKDIVFSLSVSFILCSLEFVSKYGLDNLLIPLFGYITYISFGEGFFVSFCFAFAVLLISLIFGWLTFGGSLTAFILGTYIMHLGGVLWVLPMILFLVLGSLVSTKKTRRSTVQVVSNGGIGFILSLIYFFTQDTALYIAHITAVSSMLSDTFSSELGMKFSDKAYWILNPFKEVPKGISGGVSVWGFFWGFLGAIPVSLFALSEFFVVLLISFFGNVMDSLFGALFENNYFWDNNFTNFTSSFLSAVFYLVVRTLSHL